jgi:hypothetical protein
VTPTAAVPAVQGEVPARASKAVRVLKMKGLVERVADAVGSKKAEVKPVVEAVLAALGKALKDGEALALPPFGKAKVSRSKDTASGGMLVMRLRGAGEGRQDKGSGKAGKAARGSLAKDDE